jgi:hypothetical protein
MEVTGLTLKRTGSFCILPNVSSHVPDNIRLPCHEIVKYQHDYFKYWFSN